MLAEFEHMATPFEGQQLVSIYFGGGTPSLWEPDCLAQIVERICQRFEVRSGDLEVSIECNPGDCEATRFLAWRSVGINRVLVGVQATNEQDLITLGRDHRMGDGLAGLERTLAAGFASVGADVILGVPRRGASLASLLDVAAAGPPHISAYELTIEDRTRFGRRVKDGDLICENEDTLAQAYESCHEVLCQQGYEHYEVSSYAKPGHRSVHNSLYWQGDGYLGLGNGAASLLCHSDGRATRWQNRRSPKRYLAARAAEHVETSEPIAAREFARETLWLAMRTSDGVAEDVFVGMESVLEPLLESELLICQEGRISPTLKGFLYNNQLITKLGLS